MKTKVEIWKLAIAMLSTAMFAACSENSLEPIIETTTDEVAFDVAVKQVDTVSISLSHTRSTDRGMGLPMGSFEMSDNGNTIYANQLAVGMIDAHNNVARSKTRGTEKTSANFYSSFGLYGYFYGEAQSWSNTMTPIISEEITQTSGSWKATKAWPGKSKGTFFAWAPYSTTDLIVSSSSTPSITYTVPSTVSSQQDILVCKTAELSSSKNPISLDFKHALTAVRFVVGNIGYFTEIKSIKIEDVYNVGTLEIGASTWTGTSGSASYEITGPFTISTLGTEEIIGGELMFLMPQTLPANAKLTVVMANGTNEETFSANLVGSNWPMGNTVTYKLSVEKIEGEYKFEVTPSTTSVDENGGDVNYTVNSYYKWNDGTIQDVPWTATYSVDGGTSTSTAGDVVSTFTASGSGNSNNSIRIAEVKKIFISDPESNEHTRTLRTTEIRGTAETPINLAGTDGSETTANCYVVSAPGYYKFPVVYGNGLKNGSKNESSLTGGASYVNHLGNTISNPYLKDNSGVVPQNAVIVWQDAYHLVLPLSVKLSSDNKYLIFQVPQEYICQGNCVLAVRDVSNTILWSWHIWVTDQNISATVSTTNTTGKYNFMPIYLGHCENDTRKTQSHAIQVNLIQNLSGERRQLSINQVGIQNLGISAPYYQWGRKDPTRPILISGSWKELYDNSEYPNVTIGAGYSAKTATLYEIVKTPYIYYCDENTCLYSSKYSDLWHVGNTLYEKDYLNANSKVVKSIYDPCPAGFKIPEIKAFSGFTIQKYTTNYYQFIPGNNWYCMGRYFQGGLRNVGTGGTCWSAGPMNQKFGYSMTYESGNCRVTDTSTHQNGFTVRPVEE